VFTAALLLAAALIAWVVTIERMRGMDAGPGTDLGGLGWFIGVWVTMMAAMMLPSTAPMVLVIHRVSGERARGGFSASVSTGIFVAGYIAAWTAYGLIAYGAFLALEASNAEFLAWDRQGPLVAGIAIAAAGAYQLTPLKRACLRHCRTPLSFVMHRWRAGRGGALAMGLEHGAWCLGCCLGLMLTLFALGVMSIAWMALVAVVILAEKALPRGTRLTGPVALCLIALGTWMAIAPSRIPGLTQPGIAPAMSPDEPAQSHPMS
jgi:predicted metal-binding membrane protein